MNKTQAKQKVNEWRELVLKQHEQLRALGLGSVKEMTSPEGGEMTVSIGWEHGYAHADIDFKPAGGSPILISVESSIRGSRCQKFIDFYQTNYEYFDELLESITKKTSVIVTATNSLFEAILEKDIPTLMMDRMMGEQLSDQPGDLLSHLAKKEVEELLKILPVPRRTLTSFSCYLPSWDIRFQYLSSWSVIMKGMDLNSSYFSPSITEAIRIVSSFPKTKELFEKFARYVIEMDKSLELLGKEE